MRIVRTFFFLAAIICAATTAFCQFSPAAGGPLPSAIQAIFDKPIYENATWGLRVVSADGTVLIDYNPRHNFFLGSVRKVFSVGELLNEIGADHTYDTPVYRTGNVDSAGVLHGNLVLVASGDLTMGGRTNPDGSIAVTDFDHNEADSLGNAELTAPDPTAGYAQLAQQIAAAGIKKVAGDVIVDDRLFQPWDFRGEFESLADLRERRRGRPDHQSQQGGNSGVDHLETDLRRVRRQQCIGHLRSRFGVQPEAGAGTSAVHRNVRLCCRGDWQPACRLQAAFH